MVVGSFKKIFDSQRIEFIPQVQSVVDPRVTGSKHMGDPPLRLDRYPTLVVAEEAGHSVESVITATNPLPTQIQPSPVEMGHVSTTPDTATTGSFGSPWTMCLGDLDEYGAGADCPLINHQINERSAKKPLLPLPDSPASLYRCKAQGGWRNHPKSPTRIRSERARHHAPSHYVDPQNKKLWPHTHPK